MAAMPSLLSEDKSAIMILPNHVAGITAAARAWRAQAGASAAQAQGQESEEAEQEAPAPAAARLPAPRPPPAASVQEGEEQYVTGAAQSAPIATPAPMPVQAPEPMSITPNVPTMVPEQLPSMTAQAPMYQQPQQPVYLPAPAAADVAPSTSSAAVTVSPELTSGGGNSTLLIGLLGIGAIAAFAMSRGGGSSPGKLAGLPVRVVRHRRVGVRA